MVFDEDETTYPRGNCRSCAHYCEVLLLSGKSVDACVTQEEGMRQVEVLGPCCMACEGYCDEYEEADWL